MNIEMADLDMILNYLETTSLEPHDDYTSEFTYKDQKTLYRYIKELQQENQQLKLQISAREEEYLKLESNWNEVKKWSEKRIENANKYLNNPTKYWDEDSRGYVLARKFQLEELLKTMQELEKGKSE